MSPGLSFRSILATLVVVAWCGLVCAGADDSPATDAPPDAISPETRADIRKLIDAGDFVRAESMARALHARVEAESGADSLQAARVLDLLVETLWRAGKTTLPETRMLAERVVVIRENLDQPLPAEMAVSLEHLGIIKSRVGDRAGARIDFERSLEARERAHGADHPEVAISLDNLGIFLYEESRFGEAERLLRRSLRLRETGLGPDHLDVSQSLNLLAVVLWETGDYVAARPLYERALAIREAELPADHVRIAGVLNNLAILLYDVGETGEALKFWERALAIREKTLEANHPLIATTLGNLAIALQRENDYDGAGILLARALSIWEATRAPDDIDTGRTLHLLGNLKHEVGDVEAALPLLERAMTILEGGFGPEHPAVAAALFDYGRALRDIHDLEAARPVLERTIAIWNRVPGPEHPYVALGLRALALLQFEAGDTEACLASVLRVEEIARRHLRITARSLAERESLQYASVRASGLDLALTLVTSGVDAAGTRAVFDSLVRSRALVLDEMAARSRVRSVIEDPEARRLLGELAASRTRLSNLLVRPVPDGSAGRYADLVAQARAEKERIERRLASRTGAYRREQDSDAIDLDAIIGHIPPHSAVVAFARYDHHDATGATGPRPSYLAFVLSDAGSDLRVVSLGNAATIDALIVEWSREISWGDQGRRPDQAEREYRKAGARLRQAIWDPIAPHVEDGEMVLVVPDGGLQIVNLATLPSQGDRYLLETGPLLHYLSTERDLVRASREQSSGEGLLAFGDPDFNATARFAALRTGGPSSPEAAQSFSTTTLVRSTGRRSGCAGFEDVMFAPLPASAQEVREITRLWTRQQNAGSLTFTGGDASEENFKRHAPGQKLLHVAAHSFFLNGECPSGSPTWRGAGSLSQQSIVPTVITGENPLLLPGLALAGANHRGVAGLGEEDGILTAEEIASLDLSGVEWAVLSACQTGLGEVRDGEGVFGLRRAFQISGVQSIIMSLWSVEDSSTRDWMARVYRARLSGLSTAESVRTASVESLLERRREGRETHPFYWGAFVVAGDWR